MHRCTSGLAWQRIGEVWLVRLAMYGLTTSPRDWSKHRDATLPSLSWVRMKIASSGATSSRLGRRLTLSQAKVIGQV